MLSCILFLSQVQKVGTNPVLICQTSHLGCLLKLFESGSLSARFPGMLWVLTGTSITWRNVMNNASVQF